MRGGIILIRRNIKISRMLPIILVFLSVVPILILAVLMLFINSHNSLVNHKKIISNQAVSTSEYLSGFYNAEKNTLIYSSKYELYKNYLYSLLSDDQDKLHTLEKRVISLQNFIKMTDINVNDVLLTDPNGKVVMSTDKDNIGSVLSKSKAYSKAVETHGVGLEVINNDINKEILMSYPVIGANSSIIGVIFHKINFDEANEYIKNIKTGLTGYIYILDPNSEVILYSDKKLVDSFDDIKKNTLNNNNMNFFTYNYQKQNMLSYYYKNQDTGLGIVSVISETEINEDGLFFNNIILLTAGITGILSLCFSYYLIHTITKPLEKLTDDISGVAEGNWDENHTNSRYNEFIKVYDAMNLMSHELNLSYKKLSESANTDVLTGLFNRKAIYEIMDKKFTNKSNAALLLDLDGFKAINDKYGHDFGDEVLIMVGNMLKKLESNNIFPARLGGDEFFIFVDRYKDRNAIEEIAKNLWEEISNIKEVMEKPISLSVSIGIALSDESDVWYQSLIKKADLSMYEVKRNGKSGWSFHR